MAINDLKMIGTFSELSADQLHVSIYKSLDKVAKRQAMLTQFSHYIVENMKFYHPCWLVAFKRTCERGLFPPKAERVYAFIDAVSGYRTEIDAFPSLTDNVDHSVPIVEAVIQNERILRPYMVDLENYWNRQYVGKRPSYDREEIILAYEPMILVSLRIGEFHRSIVLDGVTGETREERALKWDQDDYHKF
ncbi:hypothetical protein [Geomicrobium sediminis]|uniref:Uncharacterized protein n=1 Tax=Geomicrobium sediminis TaxID=1347788 RepID=A0ABS2PHU8_9BACL|nr:hypothetical protein [Geomicrobium sediminis]MBM7635013.1 hypothetical protein [Geomicrobium sediminis]